jgi:hypothetical protein
VQCPDLTDDANTAACRPRQDDIYIVFELLDTDLAHMIRSKTKCALRT